MMCAEKLPRRGAELWQVEGLFFSRFRLEFLVLCVNNIFTLAGAQLSLTNAVAGWVPAVKDERRFEDVLDHVNSLCASRGAAAPFAKEVASVTENLRVVLQDSHRLKGCSKDPDMEVGRRARRGEGRAEK